MGGFDRSAIRDAFEEGRRVHGALGVSCDAFEQAASMDDPSGPAVPLAAADLYLALACAAGNEEGWRRLCGECLPRVKRFLMRRGVREAEADALLEDLPGYLCEVPARAARSRIASYRGGSALVTWLCVVAWRLRERRRLADASARPLPDSDFLPGSSAPTPLTTALGRERARLFEEALHDAWGHLTPRECLAVLLRYRDGLPQKEIGRLLGVGEPRVSRLLESGLRRLREEVGRRIRSTAGNRGGGGDEALWRDLRDIVADRVASPPGTGV